MSKKVAALQELLADLTHESHEVDSAIEEMMAEIAAALSDRPAIGRLTARRRSDSSN
jgi:hypothetical protein